MNPGADELLARLNDSLDLLAAETRRADLGAVARPIAHEFNNFLNSLLLQVAVLEQMPPQDMGSELKRIRESAKSTAELIKRWHHYRSGASEERRSLDLNEIVRDSVSAATGPQGIHVVMAPTGIALRMELQPDLPRILSFPADLRRLCNFLIRNAFAAGTSNGGSIAVRTESGSQGIHLYVEDAGPSGPVNLESLFDPIRGRPGTNSLELAACKSLVQRLEGHIQAINRAKGGISIIVDLPFGPSVSAAP